ncbi:MAG TPA: hypothetical protein PKE30_18710, partial [Niabella sp.]|nr:hypothetical protein [Niabella sp.]
MQDIQAFFRDILNDLRVELGDEFDRNFERKGFFDQLWPGSRWPNSRGSLLLRTGAGRRSIRGAVVAMSVVWRSSLPYMRLHNEGGEITVTAKMKRFFWAMHYKAANALVYSVKTRATRNTKRNAKLTAEAEIWKMMALKAVGSKIKVPKRQFIGWHPKVDKMVDVVVYRNLEDYLDQQWQKI